MIRCGSGSLTAAMILTARSWASASVTCSWQSGTSISCLPMVSDGFSDAIGSW